MGDDRGMTAFQRTEMKEAAVLMFVPVFFGLIFGLLARVGSWRYSSVARISWLVGTAFCATPFVILLWRMVRH